MLHLHGRLLISRPSLVSLLSLARLTTRVEAGSYAFPEDNK